MNQNTTSITIHNLDPIIYLALRERAQTTSVSLNRLIKSLLTQSLGLSKTKRIADFSAFSNQWSEEDLLEFQGSQAEFSRIDSVDWH